MAAKRERVFKMPKPKAKSRLQQIKEQPQVDIIEKATNFEEHLQKANREVQRVVDTLESVTVTPENVAATVRLLRDIQEEVRMWAYEFQNLELAYVVWRNSAMTHIKDKARASLYGEMQNQSLIPPELS